MLDPSSSDANTSTGSTAPPSSSRLAATSGAPRRARNQEDTSRTRGRATSASGRRLVLTEWREKRARPSVPANISSTPRYASPWTPISEATGPHARRSLAARGARCRGLRRGVGRRRSAPARPRLGAVRRRRAGLGWSGPLRRGHVSDGQPPTSGEPAARLVQLPPQARVGTLVEQPIPPGPPQEAGGIGDLGQLVSDQVQAAGPAAPLLAGDGRATGRTPSRGPSGGHRSAPTAPGVSGLEHRGSPTAAVPGMGLIFALRSTQLAWVVQAPGRGLPPGARSGPDRAGWRSASARSAWRAA